MEKEVNIGDEVFIFNRYGSFYRYVIGKVIKKELSDDISGHGSAMNVYTYKVMGNDGLEYFGCYDYSWIGNYYFLTKDDYIKRLNNNIDSSNKRIKEYEQDNIKIRKHIRSISKK